MSANNQQPCCGTTPLRGRIDTDKIVAEIKANRLLLDGCAGHDFSQPIDRHSKQPIPSQVVFCNWRCTRCGGWVDGWMASHAAGTTRVWPTPTPELQER